MPPNHFESEVESFLEGSHGDRTHIKRADHHTVTPLCGTLLIYVTAGSWVSPLLPLPAPATVVASGWPGPLSHNPYAWRLQDASLEFDGRHLSRSGALLRRIVRAALWAHPTRICTI